MLNNRPDGVARMLGSASSSATPTSAGYKTFRAGIAEFVADAAQLARRGEPGRQGPGAAAVRQHLQQPEHDAFVLKVKYQRTDDFFTRTWSTGADRAALEHAWTDLLGSWPYHDATSACCSITSTSRRAAARSSTMTRPDRRAARAISAARAEAARALRRDDRGR
jgi:hypothetical protein